jgi:hypothetical protein
MNKTCRVWWLAAFLALAPGAPVSAADLEVDLLPQSSSSLPPEVRLTARSDRPNLDPIASLLSAPYGSQRLQLTEGKWTVEAKAEGFWAPVRNVDLAKDGARRLEIELFPASLVKGTVQVKEDDTLPSEIGLELHRPIEPPGPSNPRPVRQESQPLTFRCPVDREGDFQCAAPAGEWDVRLRASDHISHYRWKQPFPKGSAASVGTLLLERGASVVGWSRADGVIPKGRAIEISLRPMAAGASSLGESTDRALLLKTQVDERGFFHLTGVQPGAYLLTAALPGFAPAKFFPLRVVENRETQLQAPLVLGPPIRLQVHVTPSTDLQQKPWQIEVFDLGETPGAMERVAGSKTGVDGSAETSGLPSGRLMIHLLDSAGSTWAYREVEVASGDMAVDFDLDLVEVEGTLRLGGEPLVATAYFGGRNGVPSLRIESDAAGRFRGILAREGSWPLEIEASDPPVHRSLASVEVKRAPGKRMARVDVDLPDGRLKGRVTDEQDRPVEKAQIRIQIPEDRMIHAETGPRGEFELQGLALGDLWVQASAQGQDSEATWVRLTEGSEQPVHLTLRKKRDVAGWVLGPAGGVPGAQVLALAPGEIRSQAVTDVAGRFTLRVPAAASSLEVVVLPPGHSLQARRIPLDPQGEIRLQVEPEGGNLVLQGVEKGGLFGTSTLLVSRDGVPVSLGALRNWAESNGFRWGSEGPLVVPQLGAGRYEICRVSYAQLPARLQGDPAAGRCVAGFLNPGADLLLDIPREERAAGK